jgi:prepilin-type N-terminal cleavage/methylation domain-containing protein
MNQGLALMFFSKKFLTTRTGNAVGFTLIEILVAMTIFSFAVLGMAAGTVTLTRTNQNSHWHASAVNLAQARIEELRAMTSAALSSLACPAYTSPGCSDSPVASGATFARSWQITADTPVAGVSQLNVKIDWTDYTSQSLTFSASVFQ